MKIPTMIRVAAFDIQIEEWVPVDAMRARRYGEFDALHMVIRIDTSMNSVKTVDTLFHELGHVIYWAYGIDDKDREERTVDMMATAWTQIYRDNPDILKFIQQELQS